MNGKEEEVLDGIMKALVALDGKTDPALVLCQELVAYANLFVQLSYCN